YPFEVKQDGEIVKCSITNTPKPTFLLLNKISASTGKPLEGAIFGLYDSKKKLIEKQTSDENGKVIFENLKPGTYYYRELQAPKGYQKDGDWKAITIKQYGQHVKVEVENQSITTAVQTGDDFPILLLLVVALLAVIMAVVVFRHSRKKKGEKK
ncbi:prealbumin-like fold domain-containing protein, partial [Anaerovorax odorimutans]